VRRSAPDIAPNPQRLSSTLSDVRTTFISGLKLPLSDLGLHPLRPILERMQRDEPET